MCCVALRIERDFFPFFSDFFREFEIFSLVLLVLDKGIIHNYFKWGRRYRSRSKGFFKGSKLHIIKCDNTNHFSNLLFIKIVEKRSFEFPTSRNRGILTHFHFKHGTRERVKMKSNPNRTLFTSFWLIIHNLYIKYFGDFRYQKLNVRERLA